MVRTYVGFFRANIRTSFWINFDSPTKKVNLAGRLTYISMWLTWMGIRPLGLRLLYFFTLCSWRLHVYKMQRGVYAPLRQKVDLNAGELIINQRVTTFLCNGLTQNKEKGKWHYCRYDYGLYLCRYNRKYLTENQINNSFEPSFDYSFSTHETIKHSLDKCENLLIFRIVVRLWLVN